MSRRDQRRVVTSHRYPYIGDGVDGALRSARIDEEEAEMLEAGERRDSLLLSAERWRMQAEDLARQPE